ncbi:MAG: hypothetical protein AAGJ52_03870 [Pseudomonadota bacterium]
MVVGGHEHFKHAAAAMAVVAPALGSLQEQQEAGKLFPDRHVRKVAAVRPETFFDDADQIHGAVHLVAHEYLGPGVATDREAASTLVVDAIQLGQHDHVGFGREL